MSDDSSKPDGLFNEDTLAKEAYDDIYPLEAALKEQFERAFEADLSGVCVHTGHYAHQITRNAGADAVTIGNDIYFSAGKFVPDSDEGIRLLAHELQHVLQHQAQFRLVYQEDISQAEAEADRVEATMHEFRLHDINAPVLKDETVPSTAVDKLADTAAEAGESLMKTSDAAAGSGLSEFTKRRDKPLIRYFSRNGFSLDLTSEQYDRGIDEVKKAITTYLLELKNCITESEYEALVLRFYRSLNI